MKILPIDKVKYLRPYACSSRSDCTACSAFGRDCHFPNPYKATKQELESVPYVTELWPLSAGEPLLHLDHDHVCVVTFDELQASFDEWEQDADPLLGEDERYADVYEWMRDCIDNGFHPCLVHD